MREAIHARFLWLAAALRRLSRQMVQVPWGHVLIVVGNGVSLVVGALLVWPYLLLAPLVRRYGGVRAWLRLQWFFGWLWLGCFGVVRRAWYHPALQPDQPCVYMAEHMSLIDIPLYATTWPTPSRGLSAREYRGVPLYGWLLRVGGTAFIERRRHRQALADLEQLQQAMRRDGFSLLLVPGGTRTPDGSLPPFRRGVFRYLPAGRPVVPVYLVGLERLTLGKYLCRPGRVDVVYGAPIDPAQQPEVFADEETLRCFVQDRMREEGALLRRQRTALQRGEIMSGTRPCPGRQQH